MSGPVASADEAWPMRRAFGGDSRRQRAWVSLLEAAQVAAFLPCPVLS